jgi:dihydrofolate reductase
VYIATSLDGFIARPDGGLDWLTAVERPGEDYGYRAFFDAVDALVLGRRTYDAVLGFAAWPYAGKRCVVLTHDAPAPRHGERFFAGDPAALLDELGRDGARRVYLDGGVVIRACLAAGLVDELTLSIVPVLLGAGVPLFGGVPGRLELEASRAFPSGLVQARYRVTHRGRLATG